MPSRRGSGFAAILVPPVGPQQELVTRHYLLTEGQRYRAVKLGARVITVREADKMKRQRAVMRGES